MRRFGGAVTALSVAAGCLIAYTAVPKAADHEYVGTAKCAICHKTEAQGEMYPKWQASPHAKAYETLATDKAKEFAKAKGIEDPQTSMDCLKCHVTAAGVDAKLLGPKYAKEDGVGCESCHGAGGDYIKKATMEGVTGGTIEAASVGLVMPTEETCKTCHNEESPTFSGFDFKKMAAKIAHPMPAERKAKYEK